MAGLLNSTFGATKKKGTLAPGEFLETESTTYDPALGTVNDQTDTVAGQMGKLLSNESPYITRARTSAAQNANARGLLNSSIAVGAGEEAAIGAALPIASQDAATYSSQRLTNQNAQNDAFRFGADSANTASMFNAGEGNQFAKIEAGAAAERGLINTRADQESRLQAERAGQESTLIGARTDAESRLVSERGAQDQQLATLRGQIDTSLQQLRGGQAEALAQIEGQYRTLIQASASASNIYQDTVRAIGAILADTMRSAEQKQADVNTTIQLLQTGLSVIGKTANIDLAALLDFTAP